MSIDVSSISSSRPRECSESMEEILEVDGLEGWLSGGSCDIDLVSSSFWSVGPPSPLPPLPCHCHHHHLHLHVPVAKLLDSVGQLACCIM